MWSMRNNPSMRSKFTFALLAAGSMLAGCSTVSNLVGNNRSASGMGPAQCRAASAREFLGQELDPRIVDSARAHAGALRSRVVRPDDVVTRADVDPLRLTVETNDAGKIRRLRCG